MKEQNVLTRTGLGVFFSMLPLLFVGSIKCYPQSPCKDDSRALLQTGQMREESASVGLSIEISGELSKLRQSKKLRVKMRRPSGVSLTDFVNSLYFQLSKFPTGQVRGTRVGECFLSTNVQEIVAQIKDSKNVTSDHDPAKYQESEDGSLLEFTIDLSELYWQDLLSSTLTETTLSAIPAGSYYICLKGQVSYATALPANAPRLSTTYTSNIIEVTLPPSPLAPGL
jgi:hypothetical protein